MCSRCTERSSASPRIGEEMKEGPPSLNSSSSAGFNIDEVCMRRHQHFSESLKDLKDLKAQLYSAAQHFEQSYIQHRQKIMVMNTVKEYTTKALVNSVDHLGSLACKVDALLNEKIEDLSANELRLSCLHQRIRTCRKYAIEDGVSQQSLSLTTPYHHKRYILPAVAEKVHHEDRMHRQDCIVNGMTEVAKRESRETSTSVARRWHSTSGSRQASSSPTLSFSFGSKSSNRKSGKRSLSPFGFIARSGSLEDRSTSPTPTAYKANRSPSEPRRSYSTFSRAETDLRTGDIPLYSGKNKCLCEALLSIRGSKK